MRGVAAAVPAAGSPGGGTTVSASSRWGGGSRGGGGGGAGTGNRPAPRLECLHEIVRALKPLVGGLRHHLLGDLEHGALIVGFERRRGDAFHNVFVADRERVLAVERHV